MKLFDKFKKTTANASLDNLMAENYTQKYLDECKFIWKNYVPKNSQAENLQGELLREIEKIRYEAQDNGNINWDDDYSYFCDFICRSLCEQSSFSDEEKKTISSIMAFFKECGLYAQKCFEGIISSENIDPYKIAYVNDNLYNIITDKIGFLQKMNTIL